MTLKINKSKTYWTKRQLTHEEERHKGAEAFIDEAVRAYDAVMTKLEEAISARLVAISDNNGVSMTEAMRRLSKKELTGWQMSLKEFIKLSERGNLPEDLEQALRNASHRAHLSKLEAMKTLIDASIRVESYNLNADLTTFLSEEWQKVIDDTIIKDGGTLGVGYSKKALELVISKPWAQDGRTFSKRIWEDGQKTSRRLQDNLEQNILLGKHPHDIIRDMQKVLPKNKRSDIARLVHTEHAYVASEADRVAFEALELEKYEICAVLDSKTSALCRSLDGKVFDLKGRKVGINAPPFHPNCRTVTVPYFEDEADGVVQESKKGYNDNIRVSGAITDTYSGKAREHAKLYYEEIRKQTTDVARIAKNTGYSKDFIQEIKNYLFLDYHDLSIGKERFEPDFAIAQSWQRLAEGRIEKHDLTLLKHEKMEREFIKLGYSQDEAHKLTSHEHDYKKEAQEYYDLLKKRQKRRELDKS